MLFLVVSTPRPERPSDLAAARQSFWPWIAGHQAWLPIDIGAVEAADIFDRDLSHFEADERVLARDLGLGIILIEIDLRERAGLRIPSPDEVVAIL